MRKLNINVVNVSLKHHIKSILKHITRQNMSESNINAENGSFEQYGKIASPKGFIRKLDFIKLDKINLTFYFCDNTEGSSHQTYRVNT